MFTNSWRRPNSLSRFFRRISCRTSSCSSRTRPRARRYRRYSGMQLASHAELAMPAITGALLDSQAQSAFHPSAELPGGTPRETPDNFVRQPRVAVLARSTGAGAADDNSEFRETGGAPNDSSRLAKRRRPGDWAAWFGWPGMDRTLP